MSKTKIKFDIYGSPYTEFQRLILSLYKWQPIPGLSLQHHVWSCLSENPNPSPQTGNEWGSMDKGQMEKKNGDKNWHSWKNRKLNRIFKLFPCIIKNFRNYKSFAGNKLNGLKNCHKILYLRITIWYPSPPSKGKCALRCHQRLQSCQSQQSVVLQHSLLLEVFSIVGFSLFFQNLIVIITSLCICVTNDHGVHRKYIQFLF